MTKRFAARTTLGLACVLAACGGDAKPPSVAPAPIASAVPAPSESARTELPRTDGGVQAAAPIPDDIATARLLRELVEVDPAGGRDRVKHETKLVMDQLVALADPRAADALASYMDRNPPPHWKTEAALLLGALGDLRAGPVLAWRMGQDPLSLYEEKQDPELRRDDSERIRAARSLADLAAMYPDAHADLRRTAEAPVLAWLTDRPQPHANGLRFLATAESTKILPKLRAWAEPKEPLPAKGGSSFSPAFATSQVALRYLGRTRDKDAFAVLARQLNRRPAQLDATMEAAMNGGSAVLVMSLRALATGAAQGLAELGDPRATPLLVKFIEDPKENEQSRLEACGALAWVATDADQVAAARKVLVLAAGSDKQRLVAQCYLDGLARTSSGDAARVLVALLARWTEASTRTAAARAIGFMGAPADVAPAIVAMLADPALHDDAALTLLLGGTPEQARAAIASYAGDTSNLQVQYARSFGFFSDAAYDRGQIARWAENSDACRDARWPVLMMSRALHGIDYDNGPHSLTRSTLRHRLAEDARSGTPPKKRQAALLLRLADEPGALASLGLPRDALLIKSD